MRRKPRIHNYGLVESATADKIARAWELHRSKKILSRRFPRRCKHQRLGSDQRAEDRRQEWRKRGEYATVRELCCDLRNDHEDLPQGIVRS